MLKKDRIAKMVEEPAKPTRRQMKDKELLSLLMKVKPHIADSIMAAANIMRNEKAQEANRLRAATILLQQYKELIDDLYNGKEEVEEESDDGNFGGSAIFSLKVVNNEETPKE